MTAEIAILNRSGIAIAADSALTIGNEKVWQFSNKLFSLGPASDIAIMVYGSGDFNGCPWELIVKQFRVEIARDGFKTVHACREAFYKFLLDKRWQDTRTETISNAHLILSRIDYVLEDLEFDGNIDFRKKIIEESKNLTKSILERDTAISNLSQKDFSTEFGEQICAFLKERTKKVVTKAVGDALTKYIYEYFRRAKCVSGFQAGVVFLGFGEDQIYPVLIETIYDGRLGNRLRSWTERQVDMNSNLEQKGVIVAFAQQDMTQLFMEGISSQYMMFFMNVITGILDEKSKYFLDAWIPNEDERKVERAIQEKQNEDIKHEILTAVMAMKQQEVINPLMDAIRALPREEMMAMAEAFVELTSMRRKVDSRLQTVGGPVDVAFISKGDGFVWKERKLYFDGNLNGDYFDRRAKRLGA